MEKHKDGVERMLTLSCGKGRTMLWKVHCINGKTTLWKMQDDVAERALWKR